MTTQEDRKLGQRIPKPRKGPMILRNDDMPQYVTRRGEQLDQKVNKAYERSDDPRQGRYALVCSGEQTGIHNASKLLCFEICSSIM